MYDGNPDTAATAAEQPEHSPLGASSAERWMNCSGSIALLKALELPESDEPDYRRDGTAAHDFNARLLKRGGDAWELIGETHENGAECTAEMAEAMQVYLDTARALITATSEVFIEYRISSPLHPQFYGTVDCGIVDGSTLNVTDYKHGEGIVVEVEDNPQVMYYAYGLLGQLEDIDEVVLRIVQPRSFHVDGPVRVWSTTAAYICEWAETVLLPAMHRTELDDQLDAGPWCRFCPAKLVCPLMTSLFGAACNSNPKHVTNLNNASLGRSYQYAAAVKFYLKALDEETFRRLNLGQDVPGTKLVNKKANRVYKPGADAVFVARFGDKAYTPAVIKSPAQMELVDPEAKKLMGEWAYTPQTGLTVALESDKRVAVKVQSAVDAFGSAIANMEQT